MDDLTKEFIAESQEGLERMERCLTELEKRPDDSELVAEIFRSVHTIKGTTGFLGFGRLEMLAHAGEDLLGVVRDGKLAVTPELVSGLLDLMDGLRAILRLIEGTGLEGQRYSDEDHELIAQMAELKTGKSARVRGHLWSAGEPAAQNQDTSTNSGKVGGQQLESRQVEGVAASVVATGGASIQDRTLRLDVDVLNRMMDQVGELVLTRNQILQSGPGAENFPELARRLDSVTAELRESVMQARMQPVGHVFGKFPRIVRDLARTCGRQVRAEFEGQETGLDKSLLEAVRDPLTHAVRNAVDHGIEPAEERVKAGKAAEGVVRLRAFHHGGSVVIEVTDDGGGISVERVLAKAVERGLVTPEQAERMPEREALQLVFVAGFSMAKTVTNVSGRGVGMDVVRAHVERVGGSVELESHVGVGTTVRLRMPLTLAIVPALVVRSGEQSFALPQSALMELVYVLQRDVKTVVERIGAAELYRLRERLLPLVWLDRLLELERDASAEALGFYIAVVESEGRRFGLVVDELMDPEEIVVKPLSAALRELGVFSGATVLGNGMLAMILDVAATGARAGVRPGNEAKTLGAGEEAVVQEAGSRIELENSMVVFEVRRGEPMAMPLALVERIELVPLVEIEFAGGRAVLQYRGELLPLEDEGGMLQELGMTWGESAAKMPMPAPGQWTTESWAAGGDNAGTATVLICLRAGESGTRRTGVVVRQVLDIAAGTLLAKDPEFAAQLAMVRDRLATVHREPVEQAGTTAITVFQEVA